MLKIKDLLEKRYRDVQDFEFTIEKNKLYMLQTRNGKRTAAAAVRIAVEMVKERLIDEKTPSVFLAPRDSLYDKTFSNLEEIKARKGPVIAIATEGDTVVTLTLQNSSGVAVESRTISISANGHKAAFIDELFPSVVQSTFEGTLIATATSKVAVVGLELGSTPGQFTTLPVTPLQ